MNISRNLEGRARADDMAASSEKSREWRLKSETGEGPGRSAIQKRSKQLSEATQRRESAADRLAMTLGLDGGGAGGPSLDELDNELDSAQSIRRMLLEVALNTHQDPEEALNVAMKMAEFVLQGDAVEEDFASSGAAPASAPLPDAHIAERLGMSQSHVRWTPEQDEDVRQLWDAGLPVVEIASRLGRTPASINSRVRTLRLSKRRTWRADVEEVRHNGTRAA